MKPSRGVKRGDEFLAGVSLPQLEQKLKKTPAGKQRERLHAALLRKQGRDEDAISKTLRRSKSTISRWLNKIEKGGADIDAICDGKSTGRPPKLSDEQQMAVETDLSKDPTESGFERSNWTARLLAAHIRSKFGVSYCISGALALAKRMGFSVRVPRPIPYNTPDKKVIDEYVKNTISAIKSHVAAGYLVYCLDAAGFADSPSSARGLRLVGGHETVETNFNIETTKAIGALGADTIHLDFYDKANSESVIDLLEQMRQDNDRIFVILDNAGAHKSKAIRKYVEESCGSVVLWYLPPRTPQHNPIEIVWREIKRAIAGRYFGNFEKMHEAIRRLIRNGEVAIVKLFKYMLDAIKIGRDKTLPVLVSA